MAAQRGNEHLLRRAVESNAADVGGDEVDVAVWHRDEARVRLHQALVVKLRTKAMFISWSKEPSLLTRVCTGLIAVIDPNSLWS